MSDVLRLDASLIEKYSEPVPEVGCWLWTGPANNKGYGRILTGRKRTAVSAHRLSWQIANGSIPTGMFVCHKCDTPSCVNPDHLFVGTNQDNMDDRKRKGRYLGSWNGSARIKESDVREIRDLESVMSQEQIGRHYGIAQRTVSQICRRDTWTHV